MSIRLRWAKKVQGKPQLQTTARRREKDKNGQHMQKETKNVREAHRPASSQSEAYWAILLSFNFTCTVQTRSCTNEAFIINYTELCYGWNRNLNYFLNFYKSPGSTTLANRSQPQTPRGREKGQKTTHAKQTKKCMRSTQISSLLPKRGLLGYYAIFYLYIHCTNQALYKRGPGRVWHRISQ